MQLSTYLPPAAPAPAVPAWLTKLSACRAEAAVLASSAVPYARDDASHFASGRTNATRGDYFRRKDQCADGPSVARTVWNLLPPACHRARWIAEQFLPYMWSGTGTRREANAPTDLRLVLAGDSTVEQQYRSLRCIMEKSDAFAPAAPRVSAPPLGCETWRPLTGGRLRVCFVWALRYSSLYSASERASALFQRAINTSDDDNDEQLAPHREGSKVIAVVGAGAWYKSPHSGYGIELARFAKFWAALLPSLVSHASSTSRAVPRAPMPRTLPPVVLIMREPLPQHYQSEGGVYIESKERSTTSRSTRCIMSPHVNRKAEAKAGSKATEDFRLAMFKRARPRGSGIAVLALHGVLRPLAGAHSSDIPHEPSNALVLDCTHYCFPATYAMNCHLARLVHSLVSKS